MNIVRDISSLSSLYENVIANKEQKEKDLVTEKMLTEIRKANKKPFKYDRIFIQVKVGNDNPRPLYNAKIIDHDTIPGLVKIKAVTQDKILKIEVDKDKTFSIRVFNSDEQEIDRFIIKGLAIRDVRNPRDLTLIKIEQ